MTVSFEYRGTLTCTEDPCTYCRTPARKIVLDTPPFVESGGRFKTADEALQHARAMANNVYGAGAHKVGSQRRLVGDWEDNPT